MATATHEDVYRLFPDIQDHAIVELLGSRPTTDELEAASQLLQDDDEGLIDIKQRFGDRLNLLVTILAEANVEPVSDRD